MKGLLPLVTVLALFLVTLVAAGIVAAFTVPGARDIGVVSVLLMGALVALARSGGRREPAPPVLDSRRWTPGRGGLA